MLHSSATGRRSLQLATAGAGCSAWHYNHNRDFGADHPRWSCACGSPSPSRPHLLWNCPHRWAPQCPVTPPVNTAEERLLAKAVPRLPPAPPAVDPQGLLEDVSEAMQAALQLSGPMCVATDGASKDLVGAYSIVVQRPNDQHATGDASEDQSPYRMELMGICVALQAAVHAIDRLASRGVARCCHNMYLIVDCRSAIQAIDGTAPSDYQHLLSRAREHGQALCVCVWPCCGLCVDSFTRQSTVLAPRDCPGPGLSPCSQPCRRPGGWGFDG